MAHYPDNRLDPPPIPYSYAGTTDHYPPPGIPERRYTGGRTPSPTPSEVEATSNLLNYKKYLNWRFWARKEWIVWYIIGAVFLVAAILISVFDKQIVNWLTPAGQWMRNLKLGWLIPIAILFVISFPPLFGHEIVAILVGVIWGLGVGFAIVAAGTFLGEVGNFYAFKYCCRARGDKMEKSSIVYGCLARVVREGGFKVALIIRLSVIPGHFSTAVFSTCGMGILTFSLAAFLSLPKQLITVYLGVILEESGSGAETTKDKIISRSVLGVTIFITIVACWWIWREINRVKPAVIYERRKARQVKMTNPAYDVENNSTAALNPRAFTSESDLPLSVQPQRPAQFSLNQSSGGYAGYGGYGPSYVQGRYGDTLDDDDERKSTEIVGWETRGTQIADMRGAAWGAPSKSGHHSDDEDDSEESVATARRPEPPLPPLLPPPTSAHATTWQQHQPNPTARAQPSADQGLPNPFDDNTTRPQHRFEISDPPVLTHTPIASESTYAYPPSHALSDNPSLYTHSAQPSDATYDSQYPLNPRHQPEPTDASFQSSTGGHAAEATDASYYTAAGSPTRSPTRSPIEPPLLPPVRAMSPMTLRNQQR